MAQTYLPLKLMNNMYITSVKDAEEKKRKFFAPLAVTDKDKKMLQNLSLADFAEYIMDFLTGNDNPSPYGEYYAVNIENKSQVLLREACNAQLREYYKNNLTELYTFSAHELSRNIILPFWSETKQVYKLDKDFVSALAYTDNFELSRSIVEHLPFNHFYLDVSDMETSVHGVFVSVFPKGDHVLFSFYIALKNLEWGVSHNAFSYSYEKDDTLKIELACDFDESFDDVEYSGIRNDINSYFLDDNDKNLVDYFISLSFQMICYLSSKEPDIEVSPETKYTYKPRPFTSPVRNKWSEVNMEDVGVRYGAAFRKQFEEIKKEDIEDKEDEETITDINKKRRRSPRPYLRRAHWSHYWTGRGRVNYEVRWIQPVFVGGKAKDVVIHKVS